jgi:hypothetical protein
MKTCCAALGLLAYLVTAAGAGERSDLKPFTSKDGRFIVRLPGKPKEQIAGGQHLFVLDQGAKAYVVAYQDIPKLADADAATIKKSLEIGRDAAVKKLNAKLLSSKAVKLGRYTGLEFQLEVPKLGIYRSRLFQVGERLYQLTVLGPGDFATSEPVGEFFQSFRLTKKSPE